MARDHKNNSGRKQRGRSPGASPASRKGAPRGKRASSGRSARSGESGRTARNNRRQPGRSPGGKPRRRASGTGSRTGGYSDSKSARGGKKPGKKPGGRSRQYSRSGPTRKPDRKAPHAEAGAANLPRWMKDEIRRLTRKDRQDATLQVLAKALKAFGKEDYGAARREFAKAKQLSPRSSAVREFLGLSGYRLQEWTEALAELRAYRRLAGDTTYMPMEMDSLRALERGGDVEKTWGLFLELGGNLPTEAEARVVFGSYLLDQGRPEEAWEVTGPSRLAHDPRDYELRMWFVAARAALALDQVATAKKLTAAIRKADPDLPGLANLMSGIPARRGQG